MILEIGCGVGYSTQALLKDGHKVVAVEKNQECLLKAKNRLSDYEEVFFVQGDIVKDEFRNQIIQNQQADAVICWNPGTQMDAKSLQYYLPFMIDYGLKLDQIMQNPASSYTEMMLWHVCKMAKAMGVPIHIIDRCGEVNESTDDYYHSLGGETGFKQVQFDVLEAESISDGGVPLVSQGELMKEQKVSIIFVSVLLIP